MKNTIKKEILNNLNYLNNNKKYDWLIEYVKTNQNVINRKNFFGHFTTSGIVWDENENKILLIFHKKLERFLQPGGHIEEDDKNLWEAAKREVEEETGLLVEENNKFGKKPILLDIHKIPENLKKEELEHFHFDFVYVFKKKNNQEINLQLEEVSDFKWVDLDFSFQDEALKKVTEILKNS